MPEGGQLGALLTGLAVVLTAIGSLLTARRSRIDRNNELVELEGEARTEQVDAMFPHVSVLENTLRENGLAVPKRPPEMTVEWWKKRTGKKDGSDK